MILQDIENVGRVERAVSNNNNKRKISNVTSSFEINRIDSSNDVTNSLVSSDLTVTSCTTHNSTESDESDMIIGYVLKSFIIPTIIKEHQKKMHR